MKPHTPESAWQMSCELQETQVVEPAAMLGAARRLVVVSPHPDDETLAAAGALAEALERGIAILVVSVTDGEASHAGSTVWTPKRLRAARMAELDEALLAIGGPLDAIVRLHLPDGEVSARSDALAEHLVGLLRPGDLVICPWRHDGHPDHEAVARSVLAARGILGFSLLEAPIWMWHWQSPETKEIPWHALKRMPLSRRASRRKAHALAAFRSQLAIDPSLGHPPIVSEAMLAHFQRPFESFFVHAA